MSDTSSKVNVRSEDTVHPTAIKGFQKATTYHQKRPIYTEEAVEFIKKIVFTLMDQSAGQAGGKEVAQYDVVEVGCGTGKFTASFMQRIERPLQYLATEPVGNMLEIVKEKCPSVLTSERPANDLRLPDTCVKVVVAAQCFHWFDDLTSLAEIHRVLIPGGKLVLIWNSRSTSVRWIKELDIFLDRIYAKQNVKRQQHKKWKRVFQEFSGFSPLEYVYQDGPAFTGSLSEVLTYISTLSVLSSSEEDKDLVWDFIKNHPALQGQEEITIPFDTDIYWCTKTA